MTRFKEALLAELTTHVAREAPAPAVSASARAPRRWRLATVGTVAVGAGIAGALVLAPGSGHPAYALDRKSDGSFRLTIYEINDAASANQALSKAGIRARVLVPGPPGSCPEYRVGDRAGTPPSGGASGTTDGVSWMDIPRAIPGDSTVLLLVRPSYVDANGIKQPWFMSYGAVRGDAPPCAEERRPRPQLPR